MTMRHQPRGADAPWVPGTATADVHTHTTRSDGVLEPGELVREAYDVGVRLFAIADHDSLAAFRELTAPGAPALPPGLRLVPAVEINAVIRVPDLGLPEGELHVLGIGVDPDDGAFEALLAAQRGARRTRFLAMLERLREIGRPVDEQVAAVDLAADDAIGRPTIARALVEAGFADTVEDAFERLVGHGRPGYVPRTGMAPVDAIRAIRAAGGIASLAHFYDAPRRVPLLRELMAEGLDGLESHHRSFDEETRAAVGAVARRLGLVETGGTGYHGDTGPYAESHAALVMPEALIAGLRVAISRTRCPGRP
jgi:3',5'-nucleoside bisphosphate phosphatase